MKLTRECMDDLKVLRELDREVDVSAPYSDRAAFLELRLDFGRKYGVDYVSALRQMQAYAKRSMGE